MQLEAQLSDFLQQDATRSLPIVVGLSGGVDSVALLMLLADLREKQPIDLSAIHVNHGLSPNADEWQHQVQDLCRSLAIPLEVKRVEIIKNKSDSIERLARDARYQTIAQSLQPNSLLLTGHHQNDQFETFFLRLMRGAGLKGLASMAPIAIYPNKLGQQKNLRLARPLLSVSKQDLVAYCQSKGLSWVEDESNVDLKYDRNFIRHSVAPVLSQRWPQTLDSVRRSTDALQADLALLAEYLSHDLELVRQLGFYDQHCLSASELVKLSKTKQKALVRLFIIEEAGMSPSSTAINRIFNEVLPARADQNPKVAVGKLGHVQRHRGCLYYVPCCSTATDKGCQIVLEHSQVVLPEWSLFNHFEIEVDNFTEASWTVRWDQLSDSLTQNPSAGSKKVKAILKDKNCPVWLRDKIPLIYRNDELIAVANLAFSDDFDGYIRFSAPQYSAPQ